MAFVHETAVVADSARLGDDAKVWHFCHVMAGASIGRGAVIGQNGFIGKDVIVGDRCRIQNNVSIYEGVELEADVFVGPSVVFTNVRRPRAAFPKKDAFEATVVRAGATLGANCTIVCGITVGRCALVGAGAVVTRDVPDFALVIGAPAQVEGWACRCGESLSEPLSCEACGRNYERSGEGLAEVGR